MTAVAVGSGLIVVWRVVRGRFGPLYVSFEIKTQNFYQVLMQDLCQLVQEDVNARQAAP